MLRKAEGRIGETTIDEEIVVMNLESGDFFSLTGTARAAWLLIDGTRDRGGLVGALASEFDAEEAAIEGEIAEFLDELGAAGLIEDA